MNVVAVFPQLLGPGGVQRFGRSLVDALVPVVGSEFRILSLLDPPHTIKGRSVEGFTGSRFRLARAVAKGCDLLVCGHPNLAPLAYLARARATWVHAHGIDVWRPLGRLRGAALRGATLVTGSSSDTVAKVRLVQGRHGPTEVLHPCVELPSEIDPGPGSYHLTVARLNVEDRDKGIDRLIEAAKMREGLPLHVVGDGSDRARLESIAAGDARVRFLGRISDADLAVQFRHCRSFLLPSTKEGFGIVFAEAMAWGRPAVGVAAGGAPDVIADGLNGFLLHSAEVALLADAMNRMESNLDIYTLLRVEARRTATEAFSQSAFAAKVASFVSSLRSTS